MRYKLFALIAVAILITLSFLYGRFKPLPDGMDTESGWIQLSDSEIDFLSDLTINLPNERIVKQEIFANAYELIDNASEFIVIDMFLFLDDAATGDLLPLSQNFKDKLIEKRRKDPTVDIYFITDEFNTFYRSYHNPLLQELDSHGVTVIYTDLEKMREPNPAFSTVTRFITKPFGLPDYKGGWIPGFMGDDKITVRSFVKMLDFKANHRKLIITEQESLITSANPHTGSSLHSNVGVRISSTELIKAMLASEKGIAEFSGSDIPIDVSSSEGNGDIQIKYVTEHAIERNILKVIGNAKAEEHIQIGMFYFSDRTIVNALKDAAARRVQIELILDANKDAFGREKNGIPNRQIAYELEKHGINILWYKTNGEQFHSKILMHSGQSKTTVILGSGNYTKRNLGNFNLEADLLVLAPKDAEFSQEVEQYFVLAKANSLPFEAYKDSSKLKQLIYRFQEWSGLSTF